jgi:hypothetical protein
MPIGVENHITGTVVPLDLPFSVEFDRNQPEIIIQNLPETNPKSLWNLFMEFVLHQPQIFIAPSSYSRAQFHNLEPVNFLLNWN